MNIIDESDEYYIRIRGRILGPYSVEQLKQLRTRGQFGRANEISTDRETWQSAAVIESKLSEDGGSKKLRQKSAAAKSENDASGGPPGRTMSPVWHYAVGDDQCGPVTLLELRGMISGNQLVLDDLVWKEGMTDWASIRDVPELNAVARGNISVATADSKVGLSGQQNFCFACGALTDARAEVCPKCGVRQQHANAGSEKNRTTAIILALFLGGIGAHHFYLGNTGRGVFYVLFCWTFVPAIVAFVELIVLLCMSDANFRKKYGMRESSL